MIQKENLTFKCATVLAARRFVTITPGTDTVAYTAAGGSADGITLAESNNGVVSVQLLKNLNASFFFDAEGVIALGANVEVGTDGQGITQTSGNVVCLNKVVTAAGSIGTGYNIQAGFLTEPGDAATGVMAVEENIGSWHKTTLTVSTTLGAIAGGASLGLGKLMYTLPAGVKLIKSAYMSIALDEVDGNITADTPEVGLGTVVASGAVAVLSGTATFENILTGQVAADCNGTATVKTVAQEVAIEVADAHTVYLNVADAWAASGETACPVTGSIVLEWIDVA